MSNSKFLTPDEVAERYRGGISVGTLRNWRAMRLGPSYVKNWQSCVYPSMSLMRGTKRIRSSAVHQRASKSARMISRDRHARSSQPPPNPRNHLGRQAT